MKRLAYIVVAVIAALLASGGTSAANGAREFGPYTITSPDSGTCGNDWANDIFTRRFIVQPNDDGTYTLRVVNTDGSFVTIEGRSPGACEPDSRHGQLITGGVTGKMHGQLVGTVRGGTLDPSATCGDPCYMSTFTHAFFGPTATFTCVDGGGVCDFAFEYSSGAPGLGYRQWTNASRGNTGDIADRN
jgi:hypothetical protein